MSYRLQLTGRFTQLHPVFHVSQLAPFVGTGEGDLPPPVLVDGEPQYEVDRIIGHRVTRGGLKYIVRWLGYGPEEDSILSESDLASAPVALRVYKDAHNL